MWAPPQKGYYKLNTDGSWMSIVNAASAELLAIKIRLLTGRNKKIKFQELETDVEALTKMLKDPKLCEYHDLCNVIREVVALLERDWTIIVFHANRTVNFVVDRLATMGRTKIKTGERVSFKYPPAEIFETYASEILDVRAPLRLMPLRFWMCLHL
ncbi:uncharacterized protein LOC110712046 [Chenopodium quinoa]|uniref:uncharacterized protein LOC110712046 n=1 Tax=Chenopodium quinoa TaxID=63459 RepID=UPI000B7920B8|nr:uncharacterized protein LOC110712046 [Chenopodium quinoa]